MTPRKAIWFLVGTSFVAVLFVAWRMGGWTPHAARTAPPRGDRAAHLLARLGSQPRPAFVRAPKLSAAARPAAASNLVSTATSPGLLAESTLEPLRRAFEVPRFPLDPDRPAGNQILLANRRIDAPEVRALPAAASGAQSATQRNTTPYIVQFGGPVDDDARRLLEQQGGTVRGYVPNNAVLVELTPVALSGLASLPTVQAVSEYLPSDKIQPFLSSLSGQFPDTARVQASLQTLDPTDVERVAACVREAGGEVTRVLTGTRWGTVRAALPLAALHTLASKGEVQWIEEYIPPALFNDKAAIASHLDATNAWATWGLTGKGQIVGHADTGLDTGNLATLHPDFANRVVALVARGRVGDASDPDGHGTHTAGSIFGNGTASAGQFRGMAYESSLVHQSVMDDAGYLTGLGNLYEVFAESYALGAAIHSDSWGSDTYGAYDSDCRITDLFAWDYPDHLAVFAAGNAGTDANRNGVVDLGAVGSPAAAKNIVTVGATENDRASGSGGYSSYTWYSAWPSRYPTSPIRNDYISYSATTSPYRQGMAAYSSRGPTQDGRIKPEVVAPGTDVISTKSSVGYAVWTDVGNNSRYCFGGGTSMSTPLIAGTAALLRQYAVERGGVTNPSAALVKAMLIGGSRSLTPGQYGTGAAREIPAASPNPVEGWGQPDIANTVHPTNGMVRLFDRIAPSQSATNTFPIAVTVSNTPLDIALAWIDYPATAGAGVTLVNDYDLSVSSPDGTTLYPNGGASRDSVNTVETLRIAAAQAGTYQVRVIGRNVPYSGGVAALYVRGSIDAPPVLVHTPLTSYVANSPCMISVQAQNLTPLTNGQLRVLWSVGTASVATGAWQTANTIWLGDTTYHAKISSQAASSYVYYYFEAETPSYLVRLPQNAPTSATYRYGVGAPVNLVVEGAPSRVGEPVPAYGTNSVAAGFSFQASAASEIDTSYTSRAVCKGWTGAGDVPASGTSNSVTLTLGQPSSLVWLWSTQYSLTKTYRLVDLNYVFDTQTDWVDAGTQASTDKALDLGFVGDTPYALAGWYVDGARWPDTTSASDNPATGIPMTQARSVRADYLPFWQDTDGNSLSDWWELRYFGSTNSAVSAIADLDGDGWTNLGEFLDNTDPRNAASQPMPPTITVTPLDPFQSERCPWQVSAEIDDNFTVELACFVWREHTDSAWKTNAMTWVSNNTYVATLDPPSHGAKRVDYYVFAGDLIGYYDASYCSASPVYSVIGDYEAPWIHVSPSSLGVAELSSSPTNLALTVFNYAGPDLSWTARVVYAAASFATTNNAWAHSGDNDAWCVTTNRTWNGDPVWYCGSASSRTYPNACHAFLRTPPFLVGPGGGLLFRQWIQTEADSGSYFWDGALVGVSTDGGETFTVLAPTSGYPYQISDNPESPFPAEQPCLAGNGTGWETLLLDLSAYAGQTVVVRFEFGSDGNTTEEGWYVANVAPFALDPSSGSWLVPQGAWGGLLPDQWNAPVSLLINPDSLDDGEEAVACVRFDSNDPSSSPLVPVTLRRGHTLSVLTYGPGAGVADRSFLFRNDNATVTLQADPGAYLYALLVNGVPQSGTFDFSNTFKAFSVSNVGTDQTVEAWFDYRTWTLSVSTPYGTATPSAGTHTYTHGTLITASVTSPVGSMNNLTQYVCSGWTLVGQAPPSGASSQFSVTLTNNAALTWLWSTNYWLAASAAANGQVAPSGGWYTAGQSASLTAYPSLYYHFNAWSGDLSGASSNGVLLTLPMTLPRSVSASFAPNLTAAHSVPEYWLAAHGWTSGFEAAAESDSDTDGMETWKEWLADTDPTNRLSVLKLTLLGWTNGLPQVTWIGGVSRTQILERTSSLSGPWLGVYTNTPPTPLTNTLWGAPLSGTSVFYRVRIP